MWNAITYFENLQKTLKLTKLKYSFCRVTGLSYLEEVIDNMQKSEAFFAVDDTDEGATIQLGGGYFNRRSIVVYILHKYDFKNQQDRELKLNETRTVRNKILAKLIKDSSSVPELMFLDMTRFPYSEVPGMFAAGTCGLHFIVTINEPIDLQLDAADWE